MLVQHLSRVQKIYFYLFSTFGVPITFVFVENKFRTEVTYA